MAQLMAIAGRNFKIYIRDKGAVFFSLLSMFIIIALMVFFLGDMNMDAVTDLLGQFPGRDAAADKENAKLLILAWTCAGVISINAVTVTLSVFSSMVKDKTSGRMNAIYTAPVNRLAIALGYVLAAWAASVVVCVFTLAITELYCMFSGMKAFSMAVHLKLMGMIMVNSFAYAALMYVLAAFVKSESAWSGLGTVVGTLLVMFFHYICLCVVMVIFGTKFGWMELNVPGILMMVLSVAGVYFFSYTVNYILNIQQANAMNQKLKEKYGE